jgi:cell wall assembly regulator SMI1
MGKKRIDKFIDLQTEPLENLQETSRQWLDPAQSEATLASEFASKLTSVRSFPEAMVACQEWTTRRLEMMAEDGTHLLADTQKFMETGMRFMSNGWATNGGGVTT